MPPDDRPNVVVVLSDQHRASALGCAGNDEVRTPNFDALSEAGLRFENACANYPVCTPSRATLLTGQYPTTNRVVGNDLPLPTDVPTIARTLRDRGYRTGYVGKWHLSGVPRNEWVPPGPERQGFDDRWAITDKHDYRNAEYYGDDPEPVEVDGYEPVTQTDLAVEFVERHRDEPFCLFLSWGPPHDPYGTLPDRYRDLYDPEALTMRPNAEPLLPGASAHPASATLRGPPVREWGPTTAEEFATGERYRYDDQREILADYYAAVTALDEQFGRLVDALDDAGVADETVLAYTSDHGDLLFSHGLNQKGTPHEESIGVPFVVRWPGEVPAGEVTDEPLGLVDVTPSLLGLIGVDPPAEMEGTDRSAAMRGGESDGPDSVFLTGGNWRGVRTRRYTYARVDPDREEFAHVPGGHWLLYDNEADPYQFRNRVLDAAYADVRARLSDRLDEWLADVEDPFVPTTELVRRLDLVEEWNEMTDYHVRTKARGLEGEADEEYVREEFGYAYVDPD
jgi:arylsulfatase A-like enzyme